MKYEASTAALMISMIQVVRAGRPTKSSAGKKSREPIIMAHQVAM